jgi:hypothetical protein
MSAHVHFLAALPYALPGRGLVTFPCLARGRLVHCAIDGTTLTLSWGKTARTEAELAEAFAACRPRVEALVTRLLSEGRGREGGLSITGVDAAAQVARELVTV